MKKLLPALSVLVLFAILFVYQSNITKASAPSGLPATVSTSSNLTVGTTALTAFATSTCAARIITTSASAVMLTFSDNQGKVPTGSYGHLQAASTTQAYDSGVYGCGALKIYSFSSQLVTVTETN